MGKKVARTRNLGTFTEAQFWGMIRSALRRQSMYWKPKSEAKNRARKSVKGKRHKYEYQCAKCKGWFLGKNVDVDHKIEAGSLKSFDDLGTFAERLFCEDPEGYQVLCKTQKGKDGRITHFGCHQKKTNEERNRRKETK